MFCSVYRSLSFHFEFIIDLDFMISFLFTFTFLCASLISLSLYPLSRNFFVMWSMALFLSSSCEDITAALRNCENGIAWKIWLLWLLFLFKKHFASVGFINMLVSIFVPFISVVTSKKFTFFPIFSFKRYAKFTSYFVQTF